MYQYRLSEVKSWLERLVTTVESGTIIGLPMSGKLRTVESALDSLNLTDQAKTIDLSIIPQRYVEMLSMLKKMISEFVIAGGKIIYLENCSVSTKSRRQQIKALNAVRTELGRKYIYIYSFNEDIGLRQKLISRFSYLANLRLNTLYFPYANLSETTQLIHQNEQRFSKQIKSSEYQKIFSCTGGVPFLIKSYFRDDKLSQESLSRYLSEFTSHQLLELKEPDANILDSYSRLGLLDNDGQFISSQIKDALKSINVSLKLDIDINKKVIEIDKVSVMSELGSYESEILFKLTTDKRISRQEIATICYGQQKSSNYSDYAIDKIMSRLRQTLVRLGCDSNIIKTNRGYGYSLNNDK